MTLAKVTPVQASATEFAYSKNDFSRVQALLFAKAGIRLNESKDAMVYSRLVRRLRALGIDSFDSYLSLVQTSKDEEEQFINALTTNLTAFFREAHHFSLLKAHLRASPNVRRIWCAASSTGEEPYSIAMTVAAAYRSFDTPVSIIATDIDSHVLDTADKGIYSIERAKQLPAGYAKQFLFRGKGSHAGKVKVVDEIRRMVTFMPLNLTATHWPLPQSFDVIFCRNVMIYFEPKTQREILAKMVNRLTPKGLYFAGHSENFTMHTDLVRSVGNTVYIPVK
ncbi:CheR family methyltransferase [Alteromonas sp. KUL49]|uniref:CheR family methyltransferase n=1 Tax=Alteromonas sp. KUL49 TaxID=2480798 RepID=UPI00102ED5E7|nr:CheR family methyltransferase [Alteromonas sp. KUL49]TAP39173.1 chemotaxis protein CheR [Alteromonas sp. KUL49]GEA11945.1 chemotaxis protein methyltransferase [Alteromonas sp. KUL49]